MTTNWTEEAKGGSKDTDGGGKKNKLPNGFHRVTCTKVIREKKDGSPMVSKAGPFLLAIFENSNGEAAASYWLTEKTAWKLARLMDRMGLDLDRMTKDGIHISRFEEPPFATMQLTKRSIWIEVQNADAKYPDVEDVSEDDVPPARLKEEMSTAKAGPTEEDKDDIPF